MVFVISLAYSYLLSKVSWLTNTIVSFLGAGATAVLSSVLVLLQAAMLPAINTPNAIFVKIEAVVFILIIGFYCALAQNGFIV
jgi:hypothetical protein